VLRLKGGWLFCCTKSFYKEEVEMGEGERRVERQIIY
jgi:hypothetical protein